MNENRTIYDYLQHGKQNAVTAEKLATALNTDRRSIQALIEKERQKDGEPILMSHGKGAHGYYLPSIDDSQAIQEYNENLASFKSRSKHIAATMSQIRKAKEKRFGKDGKK